jgi:hypothetical protein
MPSRNVAVAALHHSMQLMEATDAKLLLAALRWEGPA